MKKIIIELTDGSSNILSAFGNTSEKNVIKEALIFFPAMGVRAQYYNQFAESLIGEGRVIYTSDLRGQGNSSVRASKNTDWGYKEILQDFDKIVLTVKGRHPKAKIYLGGHSLGGQISCLFAAKKGDISGLVLVACCTVYYKGWSGFSKWKTFFAANFFNMVVKILGYFPGKKIGFGGLESKTEIIDWSFNANHGTYKVTNDTFDYEQALNNTEIPILAINFPKDDFAPFRATENLLEKFSSKSSIMHLTIEKDDGQYNHFNWAKNPNRVSRTIMDWIDNLK